MPNSIVESPTMKRRILVTQLDPSTSIYSFAHTTIAVRLVWEAFDQERCDNCALSLAQLRGNASTQAGGRKEKPKIPVFLGGRSLQRKGDLSIEEDSKFGDDSNFDQ